MAVFAGNVCTLVQCSENNMRIGTIASFAPYVCMKNSFMSYPLLRLYAE